MRKRRETGCRGREYLSRWNSVEAQRRVFEISKEENFVRNNGKSEVAAEAVLVIPGQVGDALPREDLIPSVEVAILQIIVQSAMKLIGARANNAVELPAERVSKLGRMLIFE